MFLFLVVLFSCHQNKKTEVQSPDGKIHVSFGISDSLGINYAVNFEDSVIIKDSKMGFQFEENQVFGKDLEIVSVSEMAVNQSWNPVYGERSEIKDNYKQTTIRLKDKSSAAREYDVTFRVYNEGVAFNYTILPLVENETLHIQKENTEFNFGKNYDCWASERAQSEIHKISVNSISNPVERPLLIETGNCTVALGEAKLIDFARMKFVSGEKENSLVAALEGEVTVNLPYTTPWRTIMIGKSAGDLLANNFYYENLNDECSI